MKFLLFTRWFLAAWLVLASASAPCQQPPDAESAAGQVKRLPDGRAGAFYEYSVAVQGLVEPIRYEWSGDLPKGLQTAGARCWGTPEKHTTEPVSLTVKVVDALDETLRQRYTLNIRPAVTTLRLATNALPTFVLGQSVAYEITAGGGEGAYQWKADASALPAGLTIEISPDRSRCFLKGTPTQVGDIRMAVSVSDTLNAAGPVTVLGRVGPAIAPTLEIASTVLPAARYKIRYTQALVASGGLPPYSWGAKVDNSLLDWLTLSPSNGILSGVPRRIEKASLNVVVVDSLGSRAEKSGLELVVEAQTERRLAIHPTSLPRAVAGLPYAAELVALESQGDVSWQADDLPQWLKITTNGATLQLSGQPDASGKVSFAIGANDLDTLEGAPVRRPITIASVSPLRYELEVVEQKPKPQPLVVLTQVLPDAVAGLEFQVDLAARGGEGPIRFDGTISNATWLKLAADGRVTGTPGSAGDAIITVRALDAAGHTSPPVALHLTALAVAATEMKLAEIPELIAIKGELFSFQFTGVGGVLPYRIQVEGAWPDGLSFEARSNRVSGVPQVAGQFALRLTAQDSSPKATAILTEFRLRVLSGQDWWNWLVPTLAVVGVITLAVAALIWVSKLRPQQAERRRRGSTLPWKH